MDVFCYLKIIHFYLLNLNNNHIKRIINHFVFEFFLFNIDKNAIFYNIY